MQVQVLESSRPVRSRGVFVAKRKRTVKSDSALSTALEWRSPLLSVEIPSLELTQQLTPRSWMIHPNAVTQDIVQISYKYPSRTLHLSDKRGDGRAIVNASVFKVQ